jgi:hypothetical protein
MWISKKMWNEMCDRIELVEENTRGLIETHTEIEAKEKFWSISSKRFYPICDTKMVKKYTHSINTNTVPNVTLEELTRLVIDGTPIERKENVEMTSKFYKR